MTTIPEGEREGVSPPVLSWKDRLFRQSVGIRQAEKLLQASGCDRRARLVERLVRKTQDGTLGTPTADPAGVADDVIQVGDNHYTVLPAERTAATNSSPLGKTLATAAAAVLAGGGGVGAVLWSLSGPRPTTDPPAAVAPETPNSGERAGVSPPAIDSDTKYWLRLVD